MPVKILCPNPDCGASYSVADETLGRLGRCKKCGTKFPLVPGTRGEGPPPSETALGAAPRPVELDLPSPFGHHEILQTLGRGGMGAAYLYASTDKGRIKIEVNDPNAIVKVDGDEVHIAGSGEPITLRVGEHELVVNSGDSESVTKKIHR